MFHVRFVGAIIDRPRCTAMYLVVSKCALERKVFFLIPYFQNYTGKVINVNLPRRKQNRLTEYDYSAPNAYFITICANKRKKLFWKDSLAGADCPNDVPLTSLGAIVQQSIEGIPIHYPAIFVDHYVIMPNHVHLLLQIHSDCNGRSMIAPTISTVVRLMKGTVSRQAGFAVWQKGFYDHVIRNEGDYRDIWNYIEGNPGKWSEDKLYIP